jgi:uncharacterized protein
MTQNRVTVGFRSDEGRAYLYDDVTGCIFPWNELREAVLRFDLSDAFEENRAALVARYGQRDVQAVHRLIRHWRETYGAFVRPWSESQWVPCPPVEQLQQHIREHAFGLLLILTEDCNLRCKYCALSELYPLNRVRTSRRMSIDTARRAVDWYVQLVEPQIALNPRKRFALSLYGGEPMANMPVLRDILQYCRNSYPDTFVPVMTTNGTLLTPRNVETLVEHDVMLAISIDGPQAEHDRLRLDARNRGTFLQIARNLRRMKQEHPGYWAAKVTSVSVYDWGTDLEAVERFFDENDDIMPRSIFINQIGFRNTTWYTRYSRDDRDRMVMALTRLRERYKQAKVEGQPTSHYLNGLVGMGISMVLLRQRARDRRPDFIPFSGACVPGEKLAVHVDGQIDMCERVNGTYPIGHLDDDGIDYERLREMTDRYRRQVLFACPQCPVTKLCSFCFSSVEGKAGFSKVPELCAAAVRDAEQNLADYVSILEKNPRADFSFETDALHLEERLLLNC